MILTRKAVISVLTRRWLAWVMFDAMARKNFRLGYGAEVHMAKQCLDHFVEYGTRIKYLSPIRPTGWQPTLLEMEIANA